MKEWAVTIKMVARSVKPAKAWASLAAFPAGSALLAKGAAKFVKTAELHLHNFPRG